MTQQERKDLMAKLPKRKAQYNDKFKFKDFEVFVLGTKGFVEVTEPLELIFDVHKSLTNTFAVRITDIDLESKVFVSRNIENDFSVRQRNLMNIFYLTAMSETPNKAYIQGVDELITKAIKEKSFELVAHHWNTFKGIAMQEGTGMKFSIAAALCYFFGDFENSQTAISNTADYIQSTSIDAALFFCSFLNVVSNSTPLSSRFSLLPLIQAVKK